MIIFQVNDMTCGHCAGVITKAVRDTDPAARVEIDLATHRVMIEPGQAGVEVLREAIEEAGYTPEAEG